MVLSMRIGTKNRETTVEAILPKIRAIPNPPNIGSVARSRLPNIIATAVSMMGLALVAVAMAMARLFSIPLFISDFEKSIKSKELLALIPIKDINPISEVAVRKKFVPATMSAI